MLKKYFDFIFQCLSKSNKKTFAPENIAIKVLKRKIKTKNFIKFEKIRTNLLRNKQYISIIDYGAGSKKTLKNERRISEIAKNSLSSPKKCSFFYNIAQNIKAGQILEFGTSLGISSLYLASAPSVKKLITIEASESIAQIAKQNFSVFNYNIDLIVDNFDNFILEHNSSDFIFDIIYIDGNHRKSATIRYFEYSLKHISENGAIIFDDIRWSVGMYEAWCEIADRMQNGIIADFFTFGVIFMNKNYKKKICSLL